MLVLYIICIGDSGDGFSASIQQRICNEQLEEEDRVLLKPPIPSQDCDDTGDIEDGEFWGDVEDNDCDDDLGSTEPGNESPSSVNCPENSASEETFEQQDENQSRVALTLAKVLTIMIAKWSYKYNITACALEAMLVLIRLFFSLISTLLSSLSTFVRGFLSFHLPCTVLNGYFKLMKMTSLSLLFAQVAIPCIPLMNALKCVVLKKSLKLFVCCFS